MLFAMLAAVQAAAPVPTADGVACAYAGLPPLTHARAAGAFEAASTANRAIANASAVVEPLAREAAARCAARRRWSAKQAAASGDYAVARVLVVLGVQRRNTGGLTIADAEALFDGLPKGIEATLGSLSTASAKDRSRAMRLFAEALRARVGSDDTKAMAAANFAESVAAMRRASNAFLAP